MDHANYSPTPDSNRPTLIDDVGAWSSLVSRHWLKMGMTWLLVMAAAVAIILSWPRKYESTAKFLVRNARQDLVVSPTDGLPATYRDGVSEEALNSEIELLRSRDLLTKVANDGHLVAAEPNEDLDLAVERAVRSLNRSLDIHVIRKTNLIQVLYESRDPDQAASVLRRLADGYLARHLAVHSSPGTYEFFDGQTQSARGELEHAQIRLAALARTADLVAPDEQREAAMHAANSIEAQLAAVQAEVKERTSRLYSASNQLDRMDKRVVTQERTMPYQASVERLQTLLTEMRNKRTELLTKFSESDRLVKEIDQQIVDTKGDLDNVLRLNAKEQSTDLNTHWQSLQAEMVTATLGLAGLNAKERELKQQLKDYNARALIVTEAAPKYDAMLRDVNDAKAKYELYVKREEEARVAQALDTQKISNVVLAEAPVPSHVPSSPNRRLGLLAGAIAGAFIALAVAIADDRLRYEPRAVRAAAPGGRVVVGGSPADIAEA